MVATIPAFIVFEGIDGSGKTTVSKRIHRRMVKEDITAVWLSEPSASRWGKRIRALAHTDDHLSPQEELDLFVRDRRWNVQNNILPALQNKTRVIMDRYFYSTAAYQGARGIDIGRILEINRSFAPEPDRVFIIDIDVETALTRIERSRLQAAKRFERASFLDQVRRNYLSFQESHIIVIDGTQPLKGVLADVYRNLGFESG